MVENLNRWQSFDISGVDTGVVGTTEAEVSHRMGEEAKVLEALKGVWKSKTLFGKVKI